MEKVLFKSEEKKRAAEVASLLRTIAEKVETGEIVLSRGEQQVRLSIPETVTLELKVEEETRSGSPGVKKSLEIEIEWREGEPGDGKTSAGEVSIS